MKPRVTFTLLAIVIALGTYIKFYESQRPNTEETTRQRQYVANVKPEKVEGILIQNGDERIDLELRGGRWLLEAPIKDEADSGLINNLLSDLENWPREATISTREIDAEKGKLNELGVNKPKLRLKLSGEEAPPEILFGKDAAIDKSMYVRLNGSKETYVASQNIRDTITKKAEEFRDKKLTELTASQVERVVLKATEGEIDLVKSGEHWDLVKPLRARADDQKIGELLTQITTAQIQRFAADDKGDLHAYGLSEPRGSIALFTSSDKQGQLLQFGSTPERDKDSVFVRSAARNAVFELPKKLGLILETKPDDLRDRHLLRADVNILDRLTIQGAEQPKIVLARKDEQWIIASNHNQPANSDEVRRLIEYLSNQRVVRFVENVASNLSQYDLDKPTVQVTFSSFSAENSAESSAGERPFLTLSLGRQEGENVYARIGEEPFVVAVPKAVLEAIWTDPLRWQELTIFRARADEVKRLTVVNGGEISLQRAGKENWRQTTGAAEINQVNVESLLNTLTSLRAVRWVGASKPGQGLAEPQLALSFSVSADGASPQKLIVGGAAGDGMWFAHVEGREGTFIIANPDFTALCLPLVKPPLPKASVSSQ